MQRQILAIASCSPAMLQDRSKGEVMQRQILAIARKELNSYFGSPLAFIFIGTFLAAVLFIFLHH
jgi:hypothetical protein